MRAVATALLLLVLASSLAACERGSSIRSLEPASGNVTGNDDVVINGSGFKEGLVVQFGKSQVKTVVLDSPNRIRIKTPSGPEGKVDVIVIRPDGKTIVLKDGFTYTRDAPAGK